MARLTTFLLLVATPVVLGQGHHHGSSGNHGSHSSHNHVSYTHYVDELWAKFNYDIDSQHFSRVELHDFLVFSDTNKDGTVSRQEYLAAATKDTPDLAAFSNGLFSTFDSNGDHNLNLSDSTDLYNRMDANGDAFITKTEFYNFWTHVLTELGHTHNYGHLLG